jgi:hypothetical protein
LFGSACNGINRAGLYAQRAAYAGGFVDDGDRFGFWNGLAAERFKFHAQQIGQFMYAFLSAGRAFVNVSHAFGYRGSIGFASRESALSALGLRQNGIDFIYQRIAFDTEFNRSETQHRTQYDGEHRHN